MHKRHVIPISPAEDENPLRVYRRNRLGIQGTASEQSADPVSDVACEQGCFYCEGPETD